MQNESDVTNGLRTTVVVDSTASLSRDQVEGLPLTIVPLQIALNGQSYQDGIDLTPDEFYRHIATSESTAQTSAPSPS